MFAERWTPLILRELLAGSHRFSELQRGLPGIPRALLAQRLGSLQRAGLIDRRPTGNGRGGEYHLSPAGLSFRPVVEALGRWGYQWAAEQLRPDNLDAGLLMWFLRRRIHVERLPAERVTVQFEFRGADKRRFWLVLRRPEVDLCLSDPGFDPDLYVTTEVRAFTQVYLGHVDIAHALGDGSVTLAGRSDLRRAFGRWIGLSPFASPSASKFISLTFRVGPGIPKMPPRNLPRRSHAPADPPAAALRAAVAVLALALVAALIALPRERATATPPSGVAARLLARGTVAKASHVRAAGIKLATRGPIDVATARVTFQPGGTTGWHVHPGPALVTVKTGQLTLHRAKGCRSRTFGAGQTFLELGPEDVNLTRNETAAVTETVVTFLLPVGAPVTVVVPAPNCRP